MKIAVTGAAGMLGTDLMARFSNDHELIGLDLPHRLAGAQVAKGVSLCGCDILDEMTFRELVAETRPDWVIHCAAYTNVDGCEKEPDKAFRLNADGARNVAKGAWGAGARMLYVSTDYVYDGRKNGPYVETDQTGPLNVYGQSKLKGELEVVNVLPGALIVRTSWLFGKNGPNFVEAILSQIGKKDELSVVSDQTGSPTYTADLADALARLIEADASGMFHAANEGYCSWFQYAEKILSLSGAQGIKVKSITTEELGRPALRPAYSVLSKEKYGRITSHRFRHWEEALQDYLRHREVAAK
ncbi:MAG: dTDP-4-dehydrorhamnose reductase [Nitrospirota bacterium]